MMDKDRREIGKRGIVSLRKERDSLCRSVVSWLKRIDELDEQIRDIVDSIIEDGDEQYE
jgi:uncharacterized coiled-coil DUF342 family protein